MLDKSSYTEVLVAPQFRVIGGQSLAKTRRTPRQSAELAADWYLGFLQVEPTIKMTSSVCGCSVQLTHEAIADRNGLKAPAPIDMVWFRMSAAERIAFVRGRLTQIWDIVETITA
jgi:hypothetical protein